MERILIALLSCLISFSSFAWNALGHQLVAQIAYDNLSIDAKQLANHYNKALKPAFRKGDFVASSVWMDYIRTQDYYLLDAFHYINIPFSRDNSPLPPIQSINAIWAIKEARAILASEKATLPAKGQALRILIHVVGDLHQPLHAASLVSHQFPKGDKGGNLFVLGKNSVGINLHRYWDTGGGAFLGRQSKERITAKAQMLERKWPCELALKHKKPRQWAEESHELAKTFAYSLTPGTIPNKDYKLNTQQVAEKRVAFAGCRLADILNHLEG